MTNESNSNIYIIKGGNLLQKLQNAGKFRLVYQCKENDIDFLLLSYIFLLEHQFPCLSYLLPYIK